MCKQLRFSIRKINEDEIEIRNSFFDGYTRGFIRLLFIGIFCMSWYQNAKYKEPPFSYEISTIKEDIIWTIYPEEKVKPLYEDYYKWITTLKSTNGTESDFSFTQFGWHSCYFYSVCHARVESE